MSDNNNDDLDTRIVNMFLDYLDERPYMKPDVVRTLIEGNMVCYIVSLGRTVIADYTVHEGLAESRLNKTLQEMAKESDFIKPRIKSYVTYSER